MKKWEIAVSSAFWGSPTEENVKKMFEDCRRSGIHLIELAIGDLKEEKLFDWEKLAEMAKEYGVKIRSFHIPFCPFDKIDPCFEDEEKRKATVAIFTSLAEKAAKVGVRYFVIHPSGEPNPDDKRDIRLAQAKKSFAEMAEAFAKFGGIPLVEDLPRTCLGNCSDEIAEILSVDDRIGIVFDTNHLLKQDNLDFIKAVGGRIVSTHVSDYDFVDERHLLPGDGDIDWPALMKALDEAHYEGPMLYELSAQKTIDSLGRPLTTDDLVKNHSEIISFKKPCAHKK